MTNIPFFDYPKLFKENEKELIRIFSKVSSKGAFILQSELKEFENKFNFGLATQVKNDAIKKYFDKQPKNSLISVEGAVKIINEDLMATVNSDDPAYFGGYLNENLIQVQSALNLSRQEVKTLIINSFKSSFLNENEKNNWISKI